ncbi:3-hydroxybenzoate 6-hydroxylase 1 [Cyphellophora attinorum]|uniref:3-hydroxybenzoate 6-hydroxylase 1 n=1 Tax=Cyphellophora attinorum TaxID=1664694 RepID=A0A0N0NNU3_9EURO|nr:3-hydroxybenzoate 6-hydroxylase 1 [Phialophora attinorum]KPI41779.1 3-hydroxybenzoate 6-hydroxylase 1 [Phialophora attinorum]
MGSISAESLNEASTAPTPHDGVAKPASFDDRILVVGAGIGGLSAAIALSRAGFKSVTVLEARDDLNEFGASIGIWPFAAKVLQSYGLEALMSEYVTTSDMTEIRNGYNNESLGYLAQNVADVNRIRYGAPSWGIHRVDYQRVLAEGARRQGCDIIFNQKVTRVNDDPLTVWCRHGGEKNAPDTPYRADLVVAADGLNSAVRSSVVSDAKFNPSPEISFRCSVPKDRMRDHPLLSPLLENDNPKFWVMEGKYVLTWPLPPQRDFDVVVNISDPSAAMPPEDGSWGTRVDKETMISQLGEMSPLIRALLDSVSQVVQWRTVEVLPIKTCRSPSGRIVLLGDAFHGMFPHNACGGSSAIEDGAVLAECAAWAARSNRSHLDATQAYEDLRTPRVRRMQERSRAGVGFLSAAGDAWERRNGALAAQRIANDIDIRRTVEERRADRPKPDMDAPWPSTEYLQWLNGYDAVLETRRYLAGVA